MVCNCTVTQTVLAEDCMMKKWSEEKAFLHDRHSGGKGHLDTSLSQRKGWLVYVYV